MPINGRSLNARLGRLNDCFGHDAEVNDAAADMRAHAGLCGHCGHAVIRPTRRGTVYLRCGLAQTDSRFAKYPRLPVSECDGYEAVTRDPT